MEGNRYMVTWDKLSAAVLMLFLMHFLSVEHYLKLKFKWSFF